MKRWKLVTQISVIFTIVTVIISLVFILIFEFSLQRVYTNENINQLRTYNLQVRNIIETNQPILDNDYNGHAVYWWQKDAETGEIYLDIEGAVLSEVGGLFFEDADLKRYIENTITSENVPATIFEELKFEDSKFYLVGESSRGGLENGYYVFTFTDNRYIKSISDEFAQNLRFTVLALIILGNVTLLLWGRLVVGRISNIQDEISLLVKTNYERPITVEGEDEIASLASSVEEMRIEILEHEQTKREIMQNISHDFKTPISVIKSYSEAIKDGISGVDEIDIIINQADQLNHKVVQLLQLNKITYLTSNQQLEEVSVAEVIKSIVNKQKYKFDREFVLELDESTYLATADNLEIAIGNIIDNAMRYAKTKIVIVLKNKKLTVYNDGEHINDAFIEKIFKPYEKGSKGEFGLGMSITQQTLAFYNLTISVKNVRKGVMFVIEPI